MVEMDRPERAAAFVAVVERTTAAEAQSVIPADSESCSPALVEVEQAEQRTVDSGTGSTSSMRAPRSARLAVPTPAVQVESLNAAALNLKSPTDCSIPSFRAASSSRS